jgi:hypothetical protein
MSWKLYSSNPNMKQPRLIVAYLVAAAFFIGIALVYQFSGANISRGNTAISKGVSSTASTPTITPAAQIATFQAASSSMARSTASSPLSPGMPPIAWSNLPPSAKVIQHKTNALPDGSPVAALVNKGAQYFELVPNQVGEFDQIHVAPESILHVSMAYPKGDPGDVINLEIEDGGTINGKGFATVVPLGDDHQIHFDFKVNQEDGVYRILARSGGDAKMLNFWVDPKS